jgi:hypothetical protein
MPAEDVHKMLLSNGVKPEEMKWTGLDELLQGKGKQKVTPQEIQEHLAGNNLQIKEVTKGRTDNRAAIEDLDKKIEEINHKFSVSNKAERDALFSEREALSEQRRNLVSTDYKGQDTKFGSYVLPGGSNYRELLLTMPPKEHPLLKEYFDLDKERTQISTTPWRDQTSEQRQRVDDISARRNEIHEATRGFAHPTPFQSAHWDEPNVLGHVRFNDRTGPNGEKILHLEELQSDWAQKIRKEGVKQDPKELAKLPMKATRYNGYWEIHTDDGQFVTNVQEWQHPDVKTDEDAIKEARRRIVEDPQKTKIVNKGQPPMPFSKTWPELLLKRMMKYAAEHGYDGVSWTPGVEQVDRYPEELRKAVDRITWTPAHGETGEKFVKAYKNGEVVFKGTLDTDGNFRDYNAAGKHINEVIGKSMGGRIVAENGGDIEGKDFTIGGEGMKGFYDKIIPDAANKLGKQWGAKVGETKIPVEEKHRYEYSGPERTLEDVELLHNIAGRYGPDIHKSPFTNKEHMYGINRVAVEGSSREVLKAMREGKSFNDAMANHGDPELAEYFGGKMDYVHDNAQKSVPYLPITPQMRAGVKSIPYSLFSIPLAAGALTLAQVKAKAQELQDKQKKTGVTQ